jgi:hypothetical protein
LSLDPRLMMMMQNPKAKTMHAWLLGITWIQ